ncbi:MAG: hypothetical protein ABW033_10460 [Acidimicrobiia bacterium]
MTATAWTAGFPVEAGLPQTVRKDPPGFHEAIWTWGYDPSARVGWYLYLLHDIEDEALRREVVTLYLPDGTILQGGGQGRSSHGRIAAGDHLELECVEPFRRWETRYDGAVAPVSWDGEGTSGDPVPVRLRFSMEAATPAWNVEGDWGEPPPNMRFHQLYRIAGDVEVGELRTPLSGSTMRGHSRRERDLSAYTGHVLATALLDDGSAFGMFCFFGDAAELRLDHGYVVIDGNLHEARVVEVPLIERAQRSGEPLRFVLTGDFGTAVVTGESIVTTYGVRTTGPQAGLATSMGIARYEWNGRVGYGPIDRSHRMPAPTRTQTEGSP